MSQLFISLRPSCPRRSRCRGARTANHPPLFEAIRRTNPAGNEFWSSRDFSKVLGYVNYRHFEAVITKAKTACSNSGQRVEDHFVGSDQMIEIGKGGQHP